MVKETISPSLDSFLTKANQPMALSFFHLSPCPLFFIHSFPLSFLNVAHCWSFLSLL